MKLCGIELKGNEAVLAVLENTGEGPKHLDLPPRKIALGDSDKASEIVAFQNKIVEFFQANSISKIIIKKRAKKGKFAGGPDTFKMEALIQITTQFVPGLEVFLVTPQALAAMEKKNDIGMPVTLNKYQHVAYLSGVYGFLHS
ncbi:DUF3010 family protein [Kiloniella sp.]|uniref:DUF3010 family protein n=1 Tax=Kiloniella sp. TaxID=1938587 RepID=UPI003B01BA8B